MKFSLTQGGILTAVVGTLLLNVFSESCTDELMTNIPVLVGGIVAWIGRYRQGDVTILGFKKPTPLP